MLSRPARGRGSNPPLLTGTTERPLPALRAERMELAHTVVLDPPLGVRVLARGWRTATVGAAQLFGLRAARASPAFRRKPEQNDPYADQGCSREIAHMDAVAAAKRNLPEHGIPPFRIESNKHNAKRDCTYTHQPP